MGFIARFLIRQTGRAAAKRFEAATVDPVGYQHRKLMELVERNRDTEYGREHGFGSVKNLKDYQKAVPVIDYEDIRERMDRIIRGEKNILTAEDPLLFAQTSGTTGSPKYVPVTPTCQGRDHSDQMGTWIHHANETHPGIFKGKIVSMVSPAVEGHVPSGLPFGSTSGMIYRDRPKIVKAAYAAPYDVFEVKDYAAKYYTLMRFGVASKVTWVATANPSSILKMCEIASEHGDALLKDIADGSLSTDIDVAPELRAVLEPLLKADPARARALEAGRKKRDGKLLPADYWPELALIGCWKGGTVGSYLERFPAWFDPDRRGMVPVRDWGYLSSEARGSIPLSDQGAGGVLTVATNVCEFVPVEQVEENPDGKDAWTFLGVDELEEGQQYYIFFSTTGGLYRYDINDVIEVVGSYNQTPLIVFRRKGRGMTNITGEKVSVNQVIDAFDAVSREMRLTLDHFKAEADLKAARYTFKVEMSEGLPAEKRREFLRRVDAELARRNIEYEAKRKSLRLNDPVLQVMKPGWYDALKRQLVDQGKRVFQAKTVLLEPAERDDSDLVEETVTFDAS